MAYRKSKEDLDALLFDRDARRNRTDPYDEKSIVGLDSKYEILQVCL